MVVCCCRYPAGQLFNVVAVTCADLFTYYSVHHSPSTTSATIAMNSIRQIQALNKRELEAGVSVSPFYSSAASSMPKTHTDTSLVHRQPPGTPTTAAPPSYSSAVSLSVSPKATLSPSSPSSASPPTSTLSATRKRASPRGSPSSSMKINEARIWRWTI